MTQSVPVSDELKACPFCGQKNTYAEFEAHTEDCYLVLKYLNAKTNKLIIAWNTRPIEDVLQTQIDSLKLQLDTMTEACGDAMRENRENMERADSLQKRLNAAVHLQSDTAEGFDWNVLDKAFQYDDLLKRVRSAYKGIENSLVTVAEFGVVTRHNILEKLQTALPELEGDPNWDKNIESVLEENKGAWEELAKGDEEE